MKDFEKYSISMLRYGTARIDEEGIHPTYMGNGASYFDSPKEALDAFIRGCTASSLFTPNAERSYSLFGPSCSGKALNEYAEYYYLPVYGKQDGNCKELKVYMDGRLFATLTREDLSLKKENLDFGEEYDLKKVLSAHDHAYQIIDRYREKWRKWDEKDAKLKLLDPLYKG